MRTCATRPSRESAYRDHRPHPRGGKSQVPSVMTRMKRPSRDVTARPTPSRLRGLVPGGATTIRPTDITMLTPRKMLAIASGNAIHMGLPHHGGAVLRGPGDAPPVRRATHTPPQRQNNSNSYFIAGFQDQ